MKDDLPQRTADQFDSQVVSQPVPAMLSISLDRGTLRGLIQDVLVETLSLIDWPAGRISLTEEEAGDACGVGRHVLRDLRLAGHIHHHKIGRRIVYTRDDLLAALDACKV
jgi:hypothetical protein